MGKQLAVGVFYGLKFEYFSGFASLEQWFLVSIVVFWSFCVFKKSDFWLTLLIFVFL
jgi:hypothetical protein